MLKVRLTCPAVAGVCVVVRPDLGLLDLDAVLSGTRPQSLGDCVPDNFRPAARNRNYEVHNAAAAKNPDKLFQSAAKPAVIAQKHCWQRAAG